MYMITHWAFPLRRRSGRSIAPGTCGGSAGVNDITCNEWHADMVLTVDVKKS